MEASFDRRTVAADSSQRHCRSLAGFLLLARDQRHEYQVEDVFGFTVSDYHTGESTMLDSLPELEAFWLAKGHVLHKAASSFNSKVSTSV
jgi:hypothetical protein